jgi:hypothetical protein
MDANLRLSRTQFHRNIGLFGYSTVLNQLGIHSPVRQICAIGAFVERVIGTLTVIPTFENDARRLDWVRGRFERLASFDTIEVQSTADIVNRTYPYIAWDAYEGFAEILNAQCGAEALTSASKRLRRSGVGVDAAALYDLTEPFLRSYLPNAVRSFHFPVGLDREQFWLSQVLYRFALHEAVNDRANQEHLAAVATTGAWSVGPDEDLVSHERLLAAVPEALVALDARERIALEAYFGFGGRPQTFAEIARRLDASEYLARAAVVKGLATLSARLDIRGMLTPQEHELSRKLFDSGMSLDAAAAEMGISSRQAQRLSVSIGKAFRRALRARTGPGPRGAEHPQPAEDTSMTLPGDVLEIGADKIFGSLKKLKLAPRLDFDRYGTAYVHLPDLSAKLPLVYVRQIALTPTNRKRLEKAGAPLDWLAQRDATLDRPDVDSRYLAWTEQLRSLGNRSWVIAEALYQLCLDQLQERGAATPIETRLHVVQRIHRVLTGTAMTLEGTIPWGLRAASVAILRIDWIDAKAIATWEDGAENVRFDLAADVIRQRSLDLPDIPPQIIDVLPELMVEGVRKGDVPLPGFAREPASTDSSVRLRWIAPSADEILQALSSSEREGLPAR